MSKRCKGCAFTEGSEANKEPDNHIKGIICLLTPMPFYCHDSFNYKDPKYDLANSIKDLPKTKRICQGWKESVAELAATGYYKEEPKETRIYGKISMITLQQIFASQDAVEKKGLWAQFHQVLNALGKKWKKYKNKSIEVQM